nr:hypothetical protein [Tanacetum cinerariifolium]
MEASYWTAASDVAPTSAPVNDGQHRRPPVNAVDQRRSTTVNATGHRSTAADHGGDRRSMVAVNDGRRWRTTVDYHWTTVDHHRTTGQRWLVNIQRWTWAGSGSGLGRVRHVACHVCTCGSHVCPRGIHEDADVDNMPYVGIDPSTSWIDS